MAGSESSGLPDAEFTGERVIPGLVDADLFNEHLSRYAFASRYATSKRVLDIGCGAGYGAALLAETAEHVTATDNSDEAIAYAREHYRKDNLHFEVRDAAARVDQSFDLITAFEVIEHLENWQELLETSRDSLSSEGCLLVSTPNKPLYAELRAGSGTNPFHVHEFEFEEFHSALTAVFPHVQMLVQNHSAGIVFSPVSPSESIDSSIGNVRVDVNQANFFLGVCSLVELSAAGHFFQIPSSANLLQERERHIALLRGEVELRTEWERKTRDELERRNREFEQLLGQYRELQEDVKSRNEWAIQQDELLRERGARIIALQTEAETAHQDYARTAAGYEAQVSLFEKAYRESAEWGHETEQRLNSELAERSDELARCVEFLHEAERTLEERTAWAQDLDRELSAWRQRFEAIRQLRWVRVGTRLHFMADLL